mmetsp:Transcript_14263/g.43813  ORF Transcript_14263/g.43813 Transcript_14263/m.43813 type:complete len:295 (+) Transcript_14263:104-988(+)
MLTGLVSEPPSCGTHPAGFRGKQASHPYAPPGFGVTGSSGALPTPFVVLARPRTGSTTLCYLLAAHPEVRMFREVFHHSFTWPAAYPLNWTLRDRDLHRKEYLDLVLSDSIPHAPGMGPKAVGIKLFPHQVTSAELTAILLSPYILKIDLRRHNCVSMYVSEQKAESLHSWQQTNTTAMRLQVSPSRLRHYCKKVEDSLACIDGLRKQADEKGQGDTWFDVDYRDLYSPERGAQVLSKAYNFLRLRSLPNLREVFDVTIGVKLDKARLRDTITNYKFVLNALSDTPRYQALLGE